MNTAPDRSESTEVMVIDDQPHNLKLFERLLGGGGYRVLPFTNGETALRALQRVRPALIVLDIKMPGLDGWELNDRLKADPDLAGIPVLFLSGLADGKAKARAFASGGVDYITKPFQSEEVIARIDTHVRLHRLQKQLADQNQALEQRVLDQVREISNSQRSTIIALARLAESRDDDTGKHILRVQEYCQMLARRLRDSGVYSEIIDDVFIETIFHASALHDIGKVAIPDSILLKTGKLTDEEFAEMKRHTTLGADTLAKVLLEYPGNPMLTMGEAIARHHHERWDGTGYPDGLVGADTPLAARIMSVGDVYDALRSRRPYKEPFPHEKCLEIISSGRGSQFDPAVLDAFLLMEREFMMCREEVV